MSTPLCPVCGRLQPPASLKPNARRVECVHCGAHFHLTSDKAPRVRLSLKVGRAPRSRRVSPPFAS